MLKEYFTDGLIQIAIILSLLRMDLNTNLEIHNHPEIEELLQGPMTAYTQTRFHHHNWNRGIGAFVHPKHIDHDIEDLIQDLQTLGRYGNNGALNTRIEAYLVSDPQAPNLASENADLSAEAESGSDNNNNESSAGNGTAPTGNHTGQSDQPKKEETPPIGAELTKEDMDLIDVLWRQDMDLGVGREMFDVNLRRELEKEREQEMQKQQQLESFEQENKDSQQQLQQNNVTFTVDSETGELIPTVLDEEASPQPEQTADPLEQAMQYIAQQLPQPQDNNIQQQQQQQQPQQFNQLEVQDPPILRQNSFEQRWADVANLLNIVPGQNLPGGAAVLDDDGDIDMQNATSHGALLQNASLATAAAATTNGSDFNLNPHTGLGPNNTAPFLTFNNTNPAGVNNNTALFGVGDNSGIPAVFGNNTSPVDTAALFNGTGFGAGAESLLQELLENEDLSDLDFAAMDLNQTNPVAQESPVDDQQMSVDDASSDSAVGSMAGSHSPQDLSDSMSNISASSSASHYHGMDGATGGHDTDEMPKLIPKQEVYDPSYNYADYGFSEEAALNSSSNETEYKYSADANPRHVAHNHSYPLQPGQMPRERKLTPEERRATSQMSRDEKKAKNMKVPFSMDDIIHSPVEEFNDMLGQYKLTEPQLQLIRDIRRRGKNKVAAQNCRKRKMEVIQSLEDEVNGIRAERDRLLRERARLGKNSGEMKSKYNDMYQEVFRSLRDDNGQPYDPNQFTLQQTADGNVFLVPVNSTSPARDHDEKPVHKRKGKKGSSR